MFFKSQTSIQSSLDAKTKLSNGGFTIIEMLFVVGIMAMFYLMVSANFGARRTTQYLKNAQAELVTNLQKIHSQSLSGRQIDGNTAKFYVIKLDKKNYPRKYFLQGIATDEKLGVDVKYNGTPDNRQNISEFSLPPTVSITGLRLTQPCVVQNSTCIPVVQDLDCVEVVYALPFGKQYVTNCAFNDIYTIYQSASTLQGSTNTTLLITLSGAGTDVGTRTITLYGISGRVEASK